MAYVQIYGGFDDEQHWEVGEKWSFVILRTSVICHKHSLKTNYLVQTIHFINEEMKPGGYL